MLVATGAAGCKSSVRNAASRRTIEDVPVTASWDFPELTKPAHVLYVEGSIPHVYAANEHDAWMVTGFVHARDRYVQMELTRRFGQGSISELVGEAALTTDQETRGRGGNDSHHNSGSSASPAPAAACEAPGTPPSIARAICPRRAASPAVVDASSDPS